MAKKYNAENITVLQGLEAVRKLPGMYIGNTNRQGLNHLVQEIVDNAVDECLEGFCTELKVTINEDGSATIKDNGRGIPVDMHEQGVPAERVVFTELHAGGKFNKGTYRISGGLHGVGSSVVNALSEKLFVNIYRDGFIHHDSYSRGIPTTELVDGFLPKDKIREKKTGTEITIYPDGEIFETTKFKASAIKQRLKETAYLNPTLTIYFENKRDKEEEIVFSYPNGLSEYISEISAEYTPTSPVIMFSGEKNGIMVDAALLFTEDGEDTVYGFTNNIANPDGGTHITGLKSGITKLINGYARNELGLLKEKDKNLSGAEVMAGMIGILSIKHPSPQFEGQTKTKLGSSDASTAVEAVAREQLTLYFDRNYEVLKTITENAIANAKKKASNKAKVDTTKVTFDGNGKLVLQESKTPEECEIFIVEGDSAGGTAKTARNKMTQAILPLRGKILNVLKQSIDKVWENAEIRAIFNALGCGVLEDFDEDKLKYHKIIIMTDADVDGSHIATLLLTLFLRLAPELILKGYVYIAHPPLYKADAGGKTHYLYSDGELNKLRDRIKKPLKVQRYKGLGEMDAPQLKETTMSKDNRLLSKVVIENMIEAKQITSVLMGEAVPPRREYIEDHSENARIDA